MNDQHWQKVKVIHKNQVSEDMLSLIVEPQTLIKHRAGQHYQLRMIGQELDRCYSVVSSPLEENILEFGIQLIPSGAISPKLWDIQEGEVFEIKGPLGEGFVWEEGMVEPVVLVGAGSGITPLLSIYRYYSQVHPNKPIKFIMSAKSSAKVMYYEQLKNNLIARFTSTQGRIDKEFLKQSIGDDIKNARIYVCGPIEFIDDMVDYLLELGANGDLIKSERFI